MMKKLIAVMAVALLAFTCVLAPSVSADSTGTQRMIVKNVYSSEFTSLGTIPLYAEEDYYYFIKDSNNHKAFLRYINGSIDKIPTDDFPVVRKGDRVVVYFFSADKYQDGYETVMEFYNYNQTTYEGYLQLSFILEYSVDAIHLFFLEGSTAKISWTSDLAGLTAYFGTENITKHATLTGGTYSAEVEIGKNGAYPLTFVNELNDSISANLSYTIEGYDQSQSIVTGVICFLLVGIAIYLMYKSYLKPKWSIVKEERKGRKVKAVPEEGTEILTEEDHLENAVTEENYGITETIEETSERNNDPVESDEMTESMTEDEEDNTEANEEEPK